MDERGEVVVVGIGNLLWADEGFGVRAVEALHAAFAFPDAVALLDGGTLGLNLLDSIASARRVLIFDAIDFTLAPGTLRVLRDAEVPAWGRTRLSPHQLGFNDVLALAQLQGRVPESLTAIGVQPVQLDDFGGSLTAPVRARIPEAIALAAQEIAAWGFPGTPRAPGTGQDHLNSGALAIDDYERGRPSEQEALRSGDPRVFALTPMAGR